MTFLRKKDFPNFTAVAPHLGMLLPHVVHNPSIFLCVFPVAAATPGSFWASESPLQSASPKFPCSVQSKRATAIVHKGHGNEGAKGVPGRSAGGHGG